VVKNLDEIVAVPMIVFLESSYKAPCPASLSSMYVSNPSYLP